MRQRPFGVRLEAPVIVEVAERAFARRPRRCASGPVERHREVKRSRNILKPMIRSATHVIGFALADAGADAPGQELRIALDIGDQVEHLLRRIGQHPLFGVGRHRSGSSAAAMPGSCASRAARSARNRRRRDRTSASAARPRPCRKPLPQRHARVAPRTPSGVTKRSTAVMLRRRLQVLADGQEIDVGRAQIVHHLQHLVARLAEADHDARTW